MLRSIKPELLSKHFKKVNINRDLEKGIAYVVWVDRIENSPKYLVIYYRGGVYSTRIHGKMPSQHDLAIITKQAHDLNQESRENSVPMSDPFKGKDMFGDDLDLM
jgi:hypothetical protein